MLIDWFTVVAQAANFLILVWLLKRFLYRPILDAIDLREKTIALKLADAEAKKTEALIECSDFRQKNEAFEKQRAALMSQAVEEAKAERQRLLDEARKTADALSAKRREALLDEMHTLNQAIGNKARQEVFAIARKALNDLASISLEERMLEVFVERLRTMNGHPVLSEALLAATASVLLKSAFELSEAQRTAIREVLDETFPAPTRQLCFETAPDLISGIELSAHGQKVAWSLADYLVSLEKGVNELQEELGKAEHHGS